MKKTTNYIHHLAATIVQLQVTVNYLSSSPRWSVQLRNNCSTVCDSVEIFRKLGIEFSSLCLGLWLLKSSYTPRDDDNGEVEEVQPGTEKGGCVLGGGVGNFWLNRGKSVIYAKVDLAELFCALETSSKFCFIIGVREGRGIGGVSIAWLALSRGAA